jgi:hypothetical protein
MNLKKIIIFDNDILFNILNEIKDDLNFELKKLNVKDLKDLKKNSFSEFLIISKKKLDNFDKSLIINIFPIKISKLIQTINIHLIKSKFVSQSDINIGEYKLNLNSKEIIKNSKKLDLTEREANLIMYLNSSPSPVKIDQLQKEVWDYGVKLDTHTVETHIYRLRKKIKDKFLDENFIESTKEGYSIN